MATATSSPDAAYALTQAYRTQQARQGAIIALLVAAYYEKLVSIEDPASIARWLDLMVPRILAGSNATSALAAQYATALRQLELPKESVLRFDPVPGSVEAQIRTSLAVVGPTNLANKMTEIQNLDRPDLTKQALIIEAKQATRDAVAGAAMRHVQSGGRNTTIAASANDQLAIGYVRVTEGKPCFFCAMLASRGLVFADDSFARSDPRFEGEGTAKVHDNCKCSLAPVYNKKTDKALEATKPFTELWTNWGAGGGTADAMLRFRRGYEHYLATGNVLDFATVSDPKAFRARNAA